MAPIALALFEAVWGEAFICMHAYTYIATHSVHHLYESVKSASKDCSASGVKPFQRLELLRHLALGTVVSQTPTAVPWSQPCPAITLISVFIIISHSMVIVCPSACSTQQRQRLRLFSLPDATRVPPGRGSLVAVSEQPPLPLQAHLLRVCWCHVCCWPYPRLCWQEQLFPLMSVLLVKALIPPCPFPPRSVWQQQQQQNGCRQEDFRIRELKQFTLTWGWQKHTTSEANSVLWA